MTGRDGYPSLALLADGGDATHVGPQSEDPIQVSGPAARLLGWLTGRSGPDSVRGAGGVELPAF